MSIDIFGSEPEGSTPLKDEDYFGLKPKWVATRDDLNQAEAQNILVASEKYLRTPLDAKTILDDHFVRKLHADMYSRVWNWAGTYRTVETSIGIEPRLISESVFTLMQNARLWVAEMTPSAIDVVVCEIHHKLVQIHPFRNGNGRMSRMFADLLLISLGQPAFSWGGGTELETASSARTMYISALRKADAGDLSTLLSFMRHRV
ncbi:MAG: mobile mystery protein B [Micrococcales bacterium]